METVRLSIQDEIVEFIAVSYLEWLNDLYDDPTPIDGDFHG